MKTADIIGHLEKWIKPTLIDDWDNTGFQLGDKDQKVDKVLLALDVDREVVDRAIEGKFDMIITHHPLLFKGVNEILAGDYKGDMLLDLIKNDILVYNAHSNLDLTKGGVNDVLAEKLELRQLRDLNIVFSDEEYDYGYGRVGNIRKTPVRDYLDLIKSALETENIIVYGDLDQEIDRVAVCGGSGSGFIDDAYKMGAQLYVTGDIKYHEAQGACEKGMVIVDAGHYDTEKVVLGAVKKYLSKKFKNALKIEIVEESSLPRIIY